jgi:hypothetical protein
VAALRAGGGFLTRVIRATRLVARDRRIPRPLRALAAIGLMPIPGPFDEAVLLFVAPIMVIFHREPMREAWRAAGGPSGARP